MNKREQGLLGHHHIFHLLLGLDTQLEDHVEFAAQVLNGSQTGGHRLGDLHIGILIAPVVPFLVQGDEIFDFFRGISFAKTATV